MGEMRAFGQRLLPPSVYLGRHSCYSFQDETIMLIDIILIISIHDSMLCS